MAKRTVAFALLLTALWAAGCGGRRERTRELPLVDAAHAPDVLTEGRALEPPPAMVGNRFVKGWRFRRQQDRVQILPDPRGFRIEIVNLDARKRHLRLRTESTGVTAGAMVELRMAEREVGRFPWAPLLEIPLPADLPLGRIPLDLRFPEGAELTPEGSGLDQALPPGEVELGEDELVQSGWSVVDLVRPVPGETILLGRFVPPDDSGPQQRFALRIEREDEEPAVVFEWRGNWMDRVRGARRIAVPLGPLDGLVRIRLLATGEGPAARWQGLRVRVPVRERTEAPIKPPSPPQVVILYILDALRADHLGHLGGDPQASPTLDALASEGVAFTRHLSVAPNTLPSTKSLFTGVYFLTLGDSKLPEDGPETLAEIFSRAGYRTGGFSGNGNLSAGHGTIRGFEHFSRGGRFLKHLKRTYSNDAERIHRAALRWLDQLAPEERVFLYVHTIHPHNPYNPPEPFRSAFADSTSSQIRGSTETLLQFKRRRISLDSFDRERLRGLYTGGLAYNDAQIGSFLEEIRRRYPPGEVLLVVTSDHGEELFDHGGVLHGHTLYEEMLHIPLFFWWPPRLEPGRVTAPTDNLDVHATLRALVGTSSAPEGRALWDLLLDPERESRRKRVRFAAASSLRGGIFMARSERYKLIWAPRTGLHCGMGGGRGRSHDPEYLFDLARDPGERVNRAGERSLEAAWLRSRLRAWIERVKAIETGVEVTELDEDTEERLRALGYLE